MKNYKAHDSRFYLKCGGNTIRLNHTTIKTQKRLLKSQPASYLIESTHIEISPEDTLALLKCMASGTLPAFILEKTKRIYRNW